MTVERSIQDRPGARRDFIRQMVDRDLAAGRYPGLVTRFPPEPNGYLHIGHAKSICLNFGLAAEFEGRCHMRFDDTNPLTEDEEYTRAIQEDVRWLGFDFGDHLYFASDYFDRMYEVAEALILKGKAYVDSASEEEIREARGTVTEPGRPTPDRARGVDENLELFRRMRGGEFPDGSLVLRGRIDLSSPNMLMRDPIFYRIRHAHHYRTGERWCIYPLYDFAHCLEDAFEGVSHSLCTLEFENNRELYDWILDEAGFTEPRPHQTEFARLNLDYTVLSKRKLIRLVREGHVRGWDDPRMPTIAGLRRRGVPPEAVRLFADLIGIARADARVEPAKLEFAIREVLNPVAPRLMGVLRPLAVTLADVPEGWEVQVEAPLFPDDGPERGVRTLVVTRSLFIEREDYHDDPPSGWKRLAPGRAVRLRHGPVIRCDEVVRNEAGEPVELRCSVDRASFGSPGEGWKVNGTIHWVSAVHGRTAEVRLYAPLFRVAEPDAGEEEDFTTLLNPDSLEVIQGAVVEPALALLGRGAPTAESRVQFERLGYFAPDGDGTGEHPVFNRVVTLREAKGKHGAQPERSGSTVRPPGDDGPAGGGRAERRDVAPPAPPVVSPEREAARAAHPVLAAQFARFREVLGLPLEEADLLSGDPATAALFEASVAGVAAAEPSMAEGAAARIVAPWILNDLRALLRDRAVDALPFDGSALAELIALVVRGELTRPLGREVLAGMVETGRRASEVVEERGLRPLSDAASLLPLVERALAAHPGKVAEYRAGRTGLLGLFIGEVMRESGGRADPALTRQLVEAALSAPSGG